MIRSAYTNHISSQLELFKHPYSKCRIQGFDVYTNKVVDTHT